MQWWMYLDDGWMSILGYQLLWISYLVWWRKFLSARRFGQNDMRAVSLFFFALFDTTTISHQEFVLKYVLVCSQRPVVHLTRSLLPVTDIWSRPLLGKLSEQGSGFSAAYRHAYNQMQCYWFELSLHWMLGGQIVSLMMILKWVYYRNQCLQQLKTATVRLVSNSLLTDCRFRLAKLQKQQSWTLEEGNAGARER